MSTKFNLVQDRDDDTLRGGIKRHAFVFGVVALVLFAAVALVVGTATVGIFKSGFDHQQRINENQARIAAERQRYVAIKDKVARFIADGDFTPYAATAVGDSTLYVGPGPRYDVSGKAKDGASVTVVARDELGVWLLLDSGDWIHRGHIEGEPSDLAVFTP